MLFWDLHEMLYTHTSRSRSVCRTLLSVKLSSSMAQYPLCLIAPQVRQAPLYT